MLSDRTLRYFAVSTQELELNDPILLESAEDPRADVCTLAAIGSVRQLLGVPFNSEVAVIAMTSFGCSSSIGKVKAGFTRRAPKQGNFARAGAQCIPAGIARAFGLHGPAFTLQGAGSVVGVAFGLVPQLLKNQGVREVWCVAVDSDERKVRTAAIRIGEEGPHEFSDLSRNLRLCNTSQSPALVVAELLKRVGAFPLELQRDEGATRPHAAAYSEVPSTEEVRR